MIKSDENLAKIYVINKSDNKFEHLEYVMA